MINPRVPAWFYDKFKFLHTLLDNKYYMDKFNESCSPAAHACWATACGTWATDPDRRPAGQRQRQVVGWFSTLTRWRRPVTSTTTRSS
jgi:NADH-quinone oxidoreductase subunit L